MTTTSRLALAFALCSLLAVGCGDDDGPAGGTDAGSGGGVDGGGGGGTDGGGGGGTDGGGGGGLDATIARPDSAVTDPRCVMGCEATLMAACPLGPASREECETDCVDQLFGACRTQFQTLLTCARMRPVTCDMTGFPTVAMCSMQESAFRTCASMM